MNDDAVELDALREWASRITQLMAEDKSNDWSEEIAGYEEIVRN